MKIKFGGCEFYLHYSGALFWPEKEILVVSDLHLEKSSHYARRGYFLPPYDSHATLLNLKKVCEQMNCSMLILLGDSFHDAQGYRRLRKEDRLRFDALRKYNPVWITGNHDGDFVPKEFASMEAFEKDGITFRHQASKDNAEISGHYHPKTDVFFQGSYISRPCFMENGEKMILPAFGTYTGGLPCSHSALLEIFQTKPRIYMLGQNKVYKLSDDL